MPIAPTMTIPKSKADSCVQTPKIKPTEDRTSTRPKIKIMAAGAPMVDAARLSNVAAGIVVAVVGTATVNPEELKKRIMNM